MENDESFCEVTIRFAINEHTVEHKSAYKHIPKPGLADKGFIFGNLVVEACEVLQAHLPLEEWDSLLSSLTQLEVINEE